jgi:hypothetical protein
MVNPRFLAKQTLAIIGLGKESYLRAPVGAELSEGLLGRQEKERLLSQLRELGMEARSLIKVTQGRKTAEDWDKSLKGLNSP